MQFLVFFYKHELVFDFQHDFDLENLILKVQTFFLLKKAK